MVDVNLNGVYYSNRAALPHMVASGYGRIVNVASVSECGIMRSPFNFFANIRSGAPIAVVSTRPIVSRASSRSFRRMLNGDRSISCSHDSTVTTNL